MFEAAVPQVGPSQGAKPPVQGQGRQLPGSPPKTSHRVDPPGKILMRAAELERLEFDLRED